MSKLIEAMAEVSALNESHGIKQRGGKKYLQVKDRVEVFRKHFADEYSIITQIIVDDGQRVVMEATVYKDEKPIASGHAEEIRGQGHVNTTSALENCESSAIGRALANFGLAGGEYASANEMEAVPRKAEALQNQGVAPSAAPPMPDVDGSSSSEQSPEPPQTHTLTAQTDDPHKDSDRMFYKELSRQLAQLKATSQVTDLFVKNKGAIKELIDRNRSRGDAVMDLFRQHEERVS